MKDEDKAKEQLINELAALRQQVSELETERKRTAELFTALTNRTTVGIYVVRNGRFRFVNSVFQKYVGYSKEELLGMDSLSLVWPEDRDMVRENAVSMLKGKRYLPYEFRYMSKGEETKWVIEAVVSIPYQGKQATMGSFMDITERKQAEEKYKQLIDDITDGYIVVQEGVIVFANRRFGEIFGYTPGQLLGEFLAQLLNRQ